MEDGPERVVAVVVVVVYDLCREEDGDASMLLLKKEEGYITYISNGRIDASPERVLHIEETTV